MVSAPLPLIGERYVVEDRVGAGAMGSVHRARDRVSGESVAIKLLRSSDQRDELRFEREFAILSRLSDAAIVRSLALCRGPQNEMCIVMEWLNGETLRDRLRRSELTLDETVRMALRILAGLAIAHESGIVHRDIKPGNIFLVDGLVAQTKLVDFGIARSMLEGETLTQLGEFVGTPGYVAPEQIRGERVGHQSDIYGLGCVLFRCLSGQPVFDDSSGLRLLFRAAQENAPPLSSVRPDLPPELTSLVDRLLRRDPIDRPKTANEVARELELVVSPVLQQLLDLSPRVVVARDRTPPSDPLDGSSSNSAVALDPSVSLEIRSSHDLEPPLESNWSVGEVQKKFEDKDCRIVMEMRSSQLIVTRVRGHAREPMVDFYLREFMGAAAKATHRMDVFHDWEAVTSFEPGVRQTFMRWAEERREHNKKLMRGVHVLAGTTMVFLALGAASIVYGSQLHVYRVRKSFDEALRKAEEMPSLDPVG